MALHRKLCLSLVLLSAIVALAGCENGPAVTGSFERSYNVTGPLRLELTNAAGDVDITGSGDGKVHVHGDVRASGYGSDSPQKRLDDTVSNPPVEQRGDTIRIGKEMSHMRNVSIAYTIQVPHDTEVNATVASGAQTIRGVRGPVKVQAASGTIRVERIERDAQLSTASGSISATDIGAEVRVKSATGTVTVANTRGDVIVDAIAGVIRVSHPGGRIEADTTSGDVDIQGAASDVKAHAMSGRVSVQGNPGADSYWELKTMSGSVQLGVPASANLHLSAEATSGEIRTDIPIVVEEQGKHSLRAHMGSGGGRVDVHTVSGEIRVTGTK
jgi:DUF4097 and DUF4098 domain-containing protein YvlB